MIPGRECLESQIGPPDGDPCGEDAGYRKCTQQPGCYGDEGFCLASKLGLIQRLDPDHCHWGCSGSNQQVKS